MPINNILLFITNKQPSRVSLGLVLTFLFIGPGLSAWWKKKDKKSKKKYTKTN